MAISKNFTIQRVFTADYYNVLTGKPLFKLDSLTECTLSNGQETVYATDKDGANIASFSHSKTASGAMTSSVFNTDLLSVITGTETQVGTFVVPHSEKLVVKDGIVKLAHKPEGIVGKNVVLMHYKNDGSFGDELEQVVLAKEHYVVGTTLTIVADGAMTDPLTEVELATVTPTLPTAQVGEKVDLVPAEELVAGKFEVDETTKEVTLKDIEDGTNLIAYYDYATGEESVNIKNKTSEFSAVCKIVLTGLGVDVCTSEEVPIKIVYYRAKVDGAWELATSKGGDPATLSCNFEALKKNCIEDELWDIFEIDEE